MNLDIFVDWITNNPEWAFAIIFGITLIESIAVIGLLMPGWLLLVGVGILIGTGSINYYFAVLFCFFGAILGEFISFSIGRHYQDRARHWKIFLKNPHWLKNTDHFFDRFGVASIALGRFVGPVRAFVPLIAGMSSMPMHRFQVINVLSALVWAPLYLIPGVVVGASFQIDTSQSWMLVFTLIMAALSAWLIVVYVRNLWFVKHPDEHPDSDNDYDHNYIGLKLVAAIAVLLVSLWVVLWGPLKVIFFELAGLLNAIIFQF